MPRPYYQLVHGLLCCILLLHHYGGSVVGDQLSRIGEEAEEQVPARDDVSVRTILEEVVEEERQVSLEEETETSNARTHNDPLCDAPMPPENGYIQGHNYSYEAVVHIHCEKGYTLSGPNNLTCLPVPFHGAPGIWVPQDEYHCLRSEVQRPLLTEHNIPEEERHWVEGVQDEFHTKENPDLEIEVRQAAFENIHCPKPSTPNHGKVVGTDYSMGSQIHYVCDEGYSLTGPPMARCLAVPDPFNHVAIWDPQIVPTCRENPPSALPMYLMPESHEEVSSVIQNERTESDPDPRPLAALPSLCSLPKVVGPCKAALPRFYFDAETMECLPFTYGGCKGNANNFETLEACQESC